jgi:hypothetical protein
VKIAEVSQVLLEHLFITKLAFAECISNIDMDDLNFTTLIRKCKEHVS